MYVKAWEAAWRSSGFDALIVPGGSLPALKHGGFAQLTPSAAYTAWFNLLDVPAGTVPVTVVAESEDGVYVDTHNDSFSKHARDQMRGSSGLPIGVQVVGAALQEEIVCKVMRDIESRVAFKHRFVAS